jgi:hypothetical protein
MSCSINRRTARSRGRPKEIAVTPGPAQPLEDPNAFFRGSLLLGESLAFLCLFLPGFIG